MKKFLIVVSLFLVSFPAFAEKTFSQSVHDFVMDCAVQPYHYDQGGKIFSKLKSVCADLQVSADQATFKLDGKVYRAQIFDSPQSDDGDLNDIIIKGEDGRVVQTLYYIVAFRDVILGLAGGDNNFPEVEETNSSPVSN
jgi:hypothetical protein